MKKLLLLFFALCMAANTWAYSFASGGIYYNITSSTAPYTVAVAGCTNGLTTLTIPSSVDSAGTTYTVTAIGEVAFMGSTSLTTISIPPSVTSIGFAAFFMSALKSIDLQASITTIEESSFCLCKNLESITIPSTVKVLGSGAFSNCTKLDTLRIPASVDSIAADAFNSDTSLTAIVVDASNANYIDVDGVLFNKDQTKLVCYPAGKTASSYTIPSTVTTIDAFAFDSCRLSSVIIPASVDSVGRKAFFGASNLSSIYAYPTTPPTFPYYRAPFGGVDTAHCVLHVPGASLADYKSADVWKSFKNIVGDISSGVASISTDVSVTVAKNGELQLVGVPAGESLGVYNTVGASIYTGKATGSALSISLPAHGVYVVQLGNASRKVIY
jgi:hypothetical protein